MDNQELTATDREHALSVARTIAEQLLATAGKNVVLSWGATDFTATHYQSMPSLAFKVNGRLFRGTVIVALNELDYYELFLRRGRTVECLTDEATFDEMADIIDRHIERGDDETEYAAFCENERRKLFSGDFSCPPRPQRGGGTGQSRCLRSSLYPFDGPPILLSPWAAVGALWVSVGEISFLQFALA